SVHGCTVNGAGEPECPPAFGSALRYTWKKAIILRLAQAGSGSIRVKLYGSVLYACFRGRFLGFAGGSGSRLPNKSGDNRIDRSLGRNNWDHLTVILHPPLSNVRHRCTRFF